MVSQDMANDEVIPPWNGAVITAWMDGLLEAANSLVGPSSKAIHRRVNRARTLSQHVQELLGSVEIPVVRDSILKSN
jgi:hypothetical protein